MQRLKSNQPTEGQEESKSRIALKTKFKLVLTLKCAPRMWGEGGVMEPTLQVWKKGRNGQKYRKLSAA